MATTRSDGGLLHLAAPAPWTASSTPRCHLLWAGTLEPSLMQRSHRREVVFSLCSWHPAFPPFCVSVSSRSDVLIFVSVFRNLMCWLLACCRLSGVFLLVPLLIGSSVCPSNANGRAEPRRLMCSGGGPERSVLLLVCRPCSRVAGVLLHGRLTLGAVLRRQRRIVGPLFWPPMPALQLPAPAF
jgi:hypothetical protein